MSAIAHGPGKDIPLAVNIVSNAIFVSKAVDAERSRLYFDLIHKYLSQNAPKVLEASMKSLGYEYESDFARRYVAQGKTEGRMELILRQLTLRFGPLTESAQARVRGAQNAQLDVVAERILTANTLEEVLSHMS